MARSFVAESLLTTSFIAPGSTGTVVLKFKPTWNSGDSLWHQMLAFYTSAAPTQRLEVLKYSDNNIYMGWLNAPGGQDARATIVDTGLFSAGSWTDIAITWNNNTPLTTVYFNGVSKQTNTNAITTPTLDAFRVGTDVSGGLTFATGDIAEIGQWGAILDTAELVALSKGYSALLVRPASLLSYWPIIGRTSPEIDLIGKADLTLVATPATVPHPRIIMPRGKRLQTKVAFVYVYMRPDADNSDGSWLNELGTNVNLYASVDETVASDTDYIQSSTVSGDKVRLQLSDPGSGVAQPFAIRYRASGVSGSATLFGRLYQGASTLIDSWSHTVNTTPTDYTHTLGSTEFALITDFNDLFIEFEYVT